MTDGNASQLVIYQSDDGRIKLDVRFVDETVWLTQLHMADLFGTTPENVLMYLKNIYGKGELDPNSTAKDFLVVRQEGARQVKRNLKHYKLDAILSAGYWVKSAVATRFRIWATQQLREYIVKGFLLNDERLKNPDKHFDYFDELAALNNLVEQYLVFAEGQALRRVPMMMNDWITKLHGFLTINDRDILSNAGKISHEVAKAFAELEYANFNKTQIAKADQLESDFDRTMRLLPKPKNKRKVHDRTKPNSTRQNALGYRRSTSWRDGRGRLPRLHAVVPVPALPVGQLRGGRPT